MTCPLDYSLCDRTVTLYRNQNGIPRRREIPNAYFQWQMQQTYDAFGQQSDTKFLLIIPGNEEMVYPGDRILEGIGPSLGAIRWEEFIPQNYPGLVEIGYVKPCYWEGQICHYEAGRK